MNSNNLLRTSFSRCPLGRIHRRAIITNLPAYTLVELFLTLAVLMIVLGLMMNLANRVRRESADKVTRQLLARLTAAMADYRKQNDGNLPPVTPLIDPTNAASESAMQTAAWLNNADTIRFLRIAEPLNSTMTNSRTTDPWADSLTRSGSSPTVLKDPWGSPIVFMPQQNPAIGMAPGDVFFFFSAGPDRQFHTREDNLYSYEESVGNADR